jgi:hypothetical protein
LYRFAFGSRGFTKMRSWESLALPVTNRAEHESSASQWLSSKFKISKSRSATGKAAGLSEQRLRILF